MNLGPSFVCGYISWKRIPFESYIFLVPSPGWGTKIYPCPCIWDLSDKFVMHSFWSIYNGLIQPSMNAGGWGGGVLCSWSQYGCSYSPWNGQHGHVFKMYMESTFIWMWYVCGVGLPAVYAFLSSFWHFVFWNDNMLLPCLPKQTNWSFILSCVVVNPSSTKETSTVMKIS